MARGRFITLEGGEGAGKSTLARSLAAELRSAGIQALHTREPGGTPLAEKLRELLLRRGGETITPTAEALMMFAARAVHLDNLIRPSLAQGTWVICDRFTDASFAYQGAGRGVATSMLEALATAVHADCWPDHTLLLDLPVAEGLRRARSRGEAGDRFESERVEFFERVRDEYLLRAGREPQRFCVINAAQTPELVLAQALQALAAWLPPS
jgi:dTMP kinase